MKILHYINNLGSGGAEKLLVDILPLISGKGNTVHLLLANGNQNIKKYEDELLKNNIRIIDLKKSLYNPAQIFNLISLIRKEKYDIVHAHLFPTQYWLAIASFFISSKTKLIKTEHSVYNSRNRKPYLKLLEIIIYKRYSTIIAITEMVNTVFTKWLNHNKIVTINNGVNLQEINSLKNSNLSNYDFIKNDSFNILMVGRFDFIAKDQMSLIEAIHLIKNPNIKVFFAGEGPNLENVKEKVKDLGLQDCIDFLGLRTDVYKLMSLVDLNVLSTNKEGLSGVALESLASGKPFIGSNVEGVFDIVPDSSYLFPPRSPRILADKIIELKDNLLLREQNVRNAIMHVQKFDINKMVESYLIEYKNTLNTNN
ncbi:glycosyltransferase [Epilithonimonas zeae]|uniref:glycosyltransferase n=1 Tax=Epilithonimonas zeae TaxID=1416779 RepID=UPI00201057A9|nr:glycosyltransferase [Epilithonimonas zeae]UQB67445.1 glycosyltransferase [Epilithonimonas zeae]